MPITIGITRGTKGTIGIGGLGFTTALHMGYHPVTAASRPVTGEYHQVRPRNSLKRNGKRNGKSGNTPANGTANINRIFNHEEHEEHEDF